jgi:hypothetical protein
MPCSCCATGCDLFDEHLARRDLNRYRRKGLDRMAHRIVEELEGRDLSGSEIVEVGGGVGGLQLELLRAGAGRVTNVELSPAYEPLAAELLASAGFADRSSFVVGNFADGSREFGPADAVVLHRVVCCYFDGEGLASAAGDVATRVVALTLPRHTWWTRLAIAAENLWHRVRRRTYRAYVHRPSALVAALRKQGFQLSVDRRGVFWELLVLESAKRA